VVRGNERDDATVVASLSAVHDGADVESWTARLSSMEVAVVTITVTEAGYHRNADGRLDLADPDVRRDIAHIRSGRAAAVVTAPGRLAVGLAARRNADAPPLAVVPCDNLPGNGAAAQAVVLDLCDAVDAGLASWVGENVAFVSTVVDRITPATVAENRETAARLTGWDDAAPVVTEPFTEWILAGTFPAGRPAWECAGARVVDDIGRFEDRKLWLLNGGHSLLAYTGLARGHHTVAEALADPICRAWLDGWWDEAESSLPFPAEELAAYRQSLVERFANARIGYRLDQIAADGSQKLPVRVLPVLRLARQRGGAPPLGAVRALGGWMAYVRGAGGPVRDPNAEQLAVRAGGNAVSTTRSVLAMIAPDLAHDEVVVSQVAEACQEMEMSYRALAAGGTS
jgi:fructuronate reductase